MICNTIFLGAGGVWLFELLYNNGIFKQENIMT